VSSPLLVDARNLACPLPVVRLALAVREASAGDVLRLLSTDPGVTEDVPHWCLATGHRLVAHGHDGAVFWHEVKKGRDEKELALLPLAR
jgi:TusA-related sulfurtransferase